LTLALKKVNNNNFNLNVNDNNENDLNETDSNQLNVNIYLLIKFYYFSPKFIYTKSGDDEATLTLELIS